MYISQQKIGQISQDLHKESLLLVINTTRQQQNYTDGEDTSLQYFLLLSYEQNKKTQADLLKNISDITTLFTYFNIWLSLCS